MSTAANPTSSQDKLTAERIAEGDITCVRFAGVMDESFEGKRCSRCSATDTFLDENALALALIGGIAYVVVPPFSAIAGYRKGAPAEVTPVRLAVPEAEALGLRVRIGL